MKKHILFSLVIAVFFVASVFGQLTINAPTESLAGDLVVLNAECRVQNAEYDESTPTDASSLMPQVSYVWSITPPELVEGKYWIGDNGRTVTFASRLPGTYYFTVAANVGDKLEIVTHRLDNITPDPPSPTPLPPVPPGPEPTPQPPININAEISALKELAKNKSLELVKSQYFDREKKALSESFLTTAKQIADGTIDTPEQARVKQRDNSRRYLSSVTRNSWQSWDKWDAALSKQLADIDAKQSVTVDQIGQAYKQIGLGLQ